MTGILIPEPPPPKTQSMTWHHDHAMDAMAYNVSKGLAEFAPCFGERELELIRCGVLLGLRDRSCYDPELHGLRKTDANPAPDCFDDPENPGFYAQKEGKEPYSIPLVLQDRVIDVVTGRDDRKVRSF